MSEDHIKAVMDNVTFTGQKILSELTSAELIISTLYDKPIFIVDEMITIGLGIISGKPKIGKSRLALRLCIDIASGTNFLGKFNTKSSKVAYYALEDNIYRIQERLLGMDGENNLQNILICNQLRVFDEVGLEEFTHTIRKNPDIKTWVLDTFQKIRPTVKSKSQNAYEEDYRFMSTLQSIAVDHNIALLLIHHSRKDTSSDDITDALLGSTGITAATDVIIAIDQDHTDKNLIRLRITGRDVERRTLRYDTDTFYVTEDDSDDSRKKNAPLQDAIVNFLKQNLGKSYSPIEISTILKKDSSSAKSAVRKALSILLKKGLIQYDFRGKYYIKAEKDNGCIGHVSSVKQEEKGSDAVSTDVSMHIELDTLDTDNLSSVASVSAPEEKWIHIESSDLPNSQAGVSVVSNNKRSNIL